MTKQIIKVVGQGEEIPVGKIATEGIDFLLLDGGALIPVLFTVVVEESAAGRYFKMWTLRIEE